LLRGAGFLLSQIQKKTSSAQIVSVDGGPGFTNYDLTLFTHFFFIGSGGGAGGRAGFLSGANF